MNGEIFNNSKLSNICFTYTHCASLIADKLISLFFVKNTSINFPHFPKSIQKHNK
jgi:hypothetical protein